MVAKSIDQLVKQEIAEMRAIKAQGLVTDPKDAVVPVSLNARIEGVRANDLSMSHVGFVEFIPDDDTIVPFIQVWLSNIHVPSNDFGVDDGYLAVVKHNPTNFAVICPFIAYNTTDTYSFNVHVTSLVPGRLEVWKS